MRRVRVIPVLLLKKSGLVKSIRFKNFTYVGDPINAVRIFNDKEIDEIIVLDIDATRERRGPNFAQVGELAGEAFIPMAYGGGISTIEEIKKLFYLGIEKVVINYQAFANPALVTEAARLVGSQSVVVSIDVKKNILGKYKVYVKNGTESIGMEPLVYALKMQEAGAGEIFLNNIDRDGTYEGYDLGLIQKLSQGLKIPLITCGGASGLKDFSDAIHSGASAVAAGSLFVFQRPHKAVLISYPSQKELKEQVYTGLA
jgi:imidazole glycerol-phosphate synthase subunit HisF